MVISSIALELFIGSLIFVALYKHCLSQSLLRSRTVRLIVPNFPWHERCDFRSTQVRHGGYFMKVAKHDLLWSLFLLSAFNILMTLLVFAMTRAVFN